MGSSVWFARRRSETNVWCLRWSMTEKCAGADPETCRVCAFSLPTQCAPFSPQRMPVSAQSAKVPYPILSEVRKKFRRISLCDLVSLIKFQTYSSVLSVSTIFRVLPFCPRLHPSPRTQISVSSPDVHRKVVEDRYANQPQWEKQVTYAGNLPPMELYAWDYAEASIRAYMYQTMRRMDLAFGNRDLLPSSLSWCQISYHTRPWDTSGTVLQRCSLHSYNCVWLDFRAQHLAAGNGIRLTSFWDSTQDLEIFGDKFISFPV